MRRRRSWTCPGVSPHVQVTQIEDWGGTRYFDGALAAMQERQAHGNASNKNDSRHSRDKTGAGPASASRNVRVA